MRTLSEQVAAVSRGEVSPTELVRAALEAVESVEDLTNAFTSVFPDDALDRARSLEGADNKGPLHGVPIAVKDLYDVAGVATTGCCAAYEHVAAEDAAIVHRLRSAGAVVVAKTNQHELAFGTDNQLSSFGPVRNPWDRDRSPGGSSGGSAAAVATRAVHMALGTDTGGSIRIPSSFCGVTGLKPTHGATSLHGLMPLAPSLDTAGPLAVSAADCALVHKVIRGFDPRDVWSRPAGENPPESGCRGLRVALPQPWLRIVSPEIEEAIRGVAKLLAEMGAEVEETEGPDPDGIRDRIAPVLVAEASRHFGHLVEDARLSEATRVLLQIGRQITAADYIAARDDVLALRREAEDALRRSDVLLVPTTAFTAPKIGEDSIKVGNVELATDATGTTRYTLPVNAMGYPAVSFPAGRDPKEMPIGAQLIGRPWSELLLCSVVAEYQAETEHHLKHAALV